jgi:hypothetical protein
MTTYRIKLRLPGPFQIGWRTVPRTFDTREAALAEAARLTAPDANLAGWEFKVVTTSTRARTTAPRMARF